MLDFITHHALTSNHFNQHTEWLIPDFVAQEQITLVYAAGGQGKSWLALAIAKLAAQHNQVIYLDYDNPIQVLNDRGILQKLIEPCPSLHYVQRGVSNLTPAQMLEHLADANRDELTGTLVVLDSLRDIGNIRSDSGALYAMTLLKNLRDAGATVLVLNHANKDGKNYEGSNNIYNSCDNMFSLLQLDQTAGRIDYLLTAEKDRGGISDCAWRINTQTLGLTALDIQEARTSEADKSFIDSIKASLQAHPEQNKAELLRSVGRERNDNAANKQLDRYNGIHWQIEKAKKGSGYVVRLMGGDVGGA